MSTESSRSLTALGVLLCTLWLAAYVAQLPVWAVPPVRDARLAMAHGPMSKDEAVRLAQQRYRGKVVRLETVEDGGHTIYVMRVLSDNGRVWTVRVDAEDGTLH